MISLKITIKDTEVNYIQYGTGKDIVLLHGWGQNIEMMKPLGDLLENDYKITIIDFPGFGKSEEPTTPWTLEDYKEMLELLIKELKIEKPIIMGHSFGGRVAIYYASTNKVEKLVLFGSPARPEKSTTSLKVKTLKSLKKLPGMSGVAEKMKKYIGSRDYKAASTIMRQVLVNVVNKDLSENAKNITASTLLIWGDNDTEASLEDAHLLETNIKDAGLVVLPGTHYAYLENLNQVINILKNFL